MSRAEKAFQRLFNLGIGPEQSAEAAKHIRFMNIWAVCVIGFGTFFSVVFLWRGGWRISLFGLGLVALMPIILNLNRRKRFTTARVSAVAAGIFFSLALTAFFMAHRIFDYNFVYAPLLMALGCFVSFPQEEKRALHLSILGLFATSCVILIFTHPFFQRESLSRHIMDITMIFMLVLMFLAFGYLFRHIWLSTEAKLRTEREKSERLLRNILPEPIAERLREDWHPIADHHADVTVLFADIVGFTGLAEKLAAEDLVLLLNRIFGEFDLLADAFGLEKIKTIGDSYMAVCGLPLERPSHVEAAASMALEMRHTIERVTGMSPHPLQLRIGIHSGPVVAGVIGLHKFSYDLWGDTVNLASRLEAQGEPGKIQISVAVKEALPERFAVVERGLCEIRGHGPVRTYFLEGEKQSASVPPAAVKG